MHERFWSLRTATQTLGTDGYLVDPHTTYGQHINPDLITLADMEHMVCVVLLGEPGSGKTTALEQAHGSSASMPDPPATALFNLGHFQTDDRLENKVFANAQVAAWIQGGHHLHLYIDGIDETTVATRVLTGLFQEYLAQWPTDRLRLRIACRTASWPLSLESCLAHVFGEEAVAVYEISPLRRRDIDQEARARGIDPNAFHDAVQSQGVAPLAARPITLSSLIDTFRTEGTLPTTQIDLYRRACLRLCEEPAQARRDALPRDSVGSDHRVAAAARIAAMTMFGGRSAIWNGPEDGDTPAGDITLAELVGGTEPVGNASASTIEIGRALLKDTLHFGLFTSRGPQRLGWAHQTYAEYLAAQWVVSNELTTTQIMSLLVSSDNDDGRLVPQIHGTAAWIASMRPDIFGSIAAMDPEVLLDGDVLPLEAWHREILTRHVFDQLVAGQMIERHRRPLAHLERLNHPRLAEQIKPYILQPDRHQAAGSLAVQVAYACRLTSVQNILADVALDENANKDIRAWAALAVCEIGDEATKARMRPLATGEVSGDTHNEIRGLALQSVWPTHISVEAMLASLTPAQTGLFGMYRRFLEHHLPERTPPGDLAAVLRWATTKVDTPSTEGYAACVDALIERGLSILDEPEIAGAVSDLIRARVRIDHRVFSYRRDSASNTFAGSRERRIITDHIVSHLSESDDVLDLLDCTPRLVGPDDFDWLLLQFMSATASTRQEWETLADRAFIPTHPPHAQQMLQAAGENAAVARLFQRWIRPIALKSSEATALRSRHERLTRRHDSAPIPVIDPEPHLGVLTLLDSIEQGNVLDWDDLQSQLMLDSTTTHLVGWPNPDVHEDPGWISADSDTRARICLAASAYIDSVSPDADAWFEPGWVANGAIAGYRALNLLQSAPSCPHREIGSEVWSAWAPIILRLHDFGEEYRASAGALLRTAHVHSPKAVINALILQLAKDNSSASLSGVLDYLDPLWDDAMSDAVFDWVRTHDLSPIMLKATCNTLLRRKASGTSDYLSQFVVGPLPSAGVTRELAIAAAVTLISHAPDAGWSVVWPVMEADTEFGREAVRLSIGSDWTYQQQSIDDRLHENDLADLYLWLDEHFPSMEEPLGSRSHAVTPEHRIHRLRAELPTAIARKGTRAACDALGRLIEARPDRQWLRGTLDDAKRFAATSSWHPLAVADILQLARAKEARLVQTGDQLLDVVEESLQRLQAELHSETPSVRFIWNEQANGTFRPADENTFSDYVKIYLDRDLRKQGIVINREVQIHQGERTDIHVNATSDAGHSGERDIITAIVEVKGSWHDDVFTALADQLVGQYLVDNQCRHGLYLVAWFRSSRWDPLDSRSQKRKSVELADARERLLSQAREWTTECRSIRSVVIDAEFRR